MGKKLIITEQQAKKIMRVLTESSDYQDLVDKIVEDLEKNYKKAIETYRDGVSGDYAQRAVFEVNVDGELIDPLNLSEYVQKKYHVGKKFSQQLLDDWCSNKINNGFLSKSISVKQ